MPSSVRYWAKSTIPTTTRDVTYTVNQSHAGATCPRREAFRGKCVDRRHPAEAADASHFGDGTVKSVGRTLVDPFHVSNRLIKCYNIGVLSVEVE